MDIDGEYREEVERDTIREEGTIECPFTGITLNKREKILRMYTTSSINTRYSTISYRILIYLHEMKRDCSPNCT